jgi:hypothetical protein
MFKEVTREEDRIGREIVNPVCEAQLLSHLKLTNKRLGYLINFYVPLIKNGNKRMVI